LKLKIEFKELILKFRFKVSISFNSLNSLNGIFIFVTFRLMDILSLLIAVDFDSTILLTSPLISVKLVGTKLLKIIS
jgi:hypothetical protein